VREELHRWIFTNVAAKWPSIARRPEKIFNMFTGYHAKPTLVQSVLERAGVDLSQVCAGFRLGFSLLWLTTTHMCS
jgi:hypothetical protein